MQVVEGTIPLEITCASCEHTTLLLTVVLPVTPGDEVEVDRTNTATARAQCAKCGQTVNFGDKLPLVDEPEERRDAELNDGPDH